MNVTYEMSVASLYVKVNADVVVESASMSCPESEEVEICEVEIIEHDFDTIEEAQEYAKSKEFKEYLEEAVLVQYCDDLNEFK